MSHELIFNNDYREQAKLSNENKILLRLIHANDKPHIMKAFEQLSSDSRQKRFFGAKKILSDNELSYFTEVDQFDHFAMAAMELNDKNEEICLAGITRLSGSLQILNVLKLELLLLIVSRVQVLVVY